MHDTVIIGEAVAGESAQVKRAIEKLVRQLSQSSFDIAELLFKIKSKGFYQGWGFATFQEYIGSLDIKKRKAEYLTKIAETMTEVGIPREKYEDLGIAKLRAISGLDPKKSWKNPGTGVETPIKAFIEGFVEKGDEMTLEEVQQHCRTLKGQVGENDLVHRNFVFTRLVDEEVIKPKLELAKMHIGSVGRDEITGEALDPSDSAAAEVVFADFDPQVEEKNVQVVEEVQSI